MGLDHAGTVALRTVVLRLATSPDDTEPRAVRARSRFIDARIIVWDLVVVHVANLCLATHHVKAPLADTIPDPVPP